VRKNERRGIDYVDYLCDVGGHCRRREEAEKVKEKYLIESIRKFLKTVPDCEFEKRHGGSYGK